MTAPVESTSGDAVTTTWMIRPSLCRRWVRRLSIDVPALTATSVCSVSISRSSGMIVATCAPITSCAVKP